MQTQQPSYAYIRARLLRFAFTIISRRPILVFNRATRGKEKDNHRYISLSLISFKDFAEISLRLDLNRPSLPSSLPFGAGIINRLVHYRFEWSAKDTAVGLSRKRIIKNERGRRKEERAGIEDETAREMRVRLNPDGTLYKRRLPAARSQSTSSVRTGFAPTRPSNQVVQNQYLEKNLLFFSQFADYELT